MLITDVTTIKLRFPMATAMADAIHYMPDRPTLLVQVHTDEGIVGPGEAAAYGGFLASDALESVKRNFRGRLCHSDL